MDNPADKNKARTPPAIIVYLSNCLPAILNPCKTERVVGIEPTQQVWKTRRLPLHHTRNYLIK